MQKRGTSLLLRYIGNDKASANGPVKNRYKFEQQCGTMYFTLINTTLTAGDTFRVLSFRSDKQHFGVSIYKNGSLGARLSSCCEFRYTIGARLGGRNGEFVLVDRKGNNPCARCEQIKEDVAPDVFDEEDEYQETTASPDTRPISMSDAVDLDSSSLNTDADTSC